MHEQPKFSSEVRNVQVGKGQYCSVLFIIQVIVNVHGHSFDTYTIVSEIRDNVDLCLGLKNIYELGGDLSMRLVF